MHFYRLNEKGQILIKDGDDIPESFRNICGPFYEGRERFFDKNKSGGFDIDELVLALENIVSDE